MGARHSHTPVRAAVADRRRLRAGGDRLWTVAGCDRVALTGVLSYAVIGFADLNGITDDSSFLPAMSHPTLCRSNTVLPARCIEEGRITAEEAEDYRSAATEDS